MKKVLVILMLAAVSFPVCAQKFELGLSAGYGSFAMKNLKSAMKANVSAIPFDCRLVSDFPSWIGLGGNFLFRFGVYSLGPEYTYTSTGARISSADYSGKYRFDLLLHSHSVGIVNSFRVATIGKFQGEVKISGGYLYTALKKEEFLQVTDTTLSLNATFHSESFYLEPGVVVSCVFPFMKIGAGCGYFFDKGGSIMTKDNEQSLKGEETSWSGLRLELKVGIFPVELLSKRKRQEQ